MLLIWTHSLDGTTDLVIDRLKDIPTFRFNVDLWREYRWSVSPRGFQLEDPTGRSCDSHDGVVFYLRKPIYLDGMDVPAGGCLENWCREEVIALWSSIHQDCHRDGLACFVHPSRYRLGKIQQLAIAKQFFEIPQWAACHGAFDNLPPAPLIAKPLTPTQIGEGKLFFTTTVDASQLDPKFPWFLQTKVRANQDVTSVYVEGQIFSYELDRKAFAGVDYRNHLSEALPWRPCHLAVEEEEAIRGFMSFIELDFGRFDFLRGDDGVLYFLEINPNGQWAWLDEDGSNGLLDAVCNAIRAHHLRVCGPN